MSITSTRKVSGSQGSPTRPEYARRGGEGESFVEVVDTNNNVWVNNNADDEKEHQQNPDFRKKEDNDEKKQVSSTGKTYIPNAIEALTASGVYDDVPVSPHFEGRNKVGVYHSNQSIVKEDRKEQYSHQYLKHFYERNEIIEEVDELV